jgi:hypothetical protein
MVDKPNFFTNPAVVCNFKVPRKMNANPASDIDPTSDRSTKQLQQK